MSSETETKEEVEAPVYIDWIKPGKDKKEVRTNDSRHSIAEAERLKWVRKEAPKKAAAKKEPAKKKGGK